MPNTSLIIPVHNDRELLGHCIASIRSHTDAEYEIVVVDNGSNDRTDEYCRKERITFVSLPWPHSLASAGNLGLKLASGDHLLLLKPHVLVTRHWLSDMLECLQGGGAGAGIVRPALIELMKPSSSAVESRHEEQSQTACLLFGRDLLNEIGFLQNSRLYGDNVFDEYVSRAEQAGYRIMTAGKVTMNQRAANGMFAGHTK